MKINVSYLLASVALLGFALAGSNSYADNWSWAQAYAEGRSFHSSASPMEKGEVLFVDSRDLIGAPVRDPKGEVIGLVNSLLLDSGGHAFAIINHGSNEEYGEGGRFTPVPFEALQVSRSTSGENLVALAMNEEQLESAPFFDPTETQNRQYEANIYRYFGIQPYWTEENLSHEDSMSFE